MNYEPILEYIAVPAVNGKPVKLPKFRRDNLEPWGTEAAALSLYTSYASIYAEGSPDSIVVINTTVTDPTHPRAIVAVIYTADIEAELDRLDDLGVLGTGFWKHGRRSAAINAAIRAYECGADQ